MDFKEIGLDDAYLIRLVQSSGRWQALVKELPGSMNGVAQLPKPLFAFEEVLCSMKLVSLCLFYITRIVVSNENVTQTSACNISAKDLNRSFFKTA
jgi:hypothetical protein